MRSGAVRRRRCVAMMANVSVMPIMRPERPWTKSSSAAPEHQGTGRREGHHAMTIWSMPRGMPDSGTSNFCGTMAAAMEYETARRAVRWYSTSAAHWRLLFVRVGPRRALKKSATRTSSVPGNASAAMTTIAAASLRHGGARFWRRIDKRLIRTYFVDARSTNDVNAQQRFFRRTPKRLRSA